MDHEHHPHHPKPPAQVESLNHIALVASAFFWGSMLVSLAIAGVAAYPVNRWLIARGKGHAGIHAHH